MRTLFSRNFAYAKFRENKILAKISEFTVIGCLSFHIKGVLLLGPFYSLFVVAPIVLVFCVVSFLCCGSCCPFKFSNHLAEVERWLPI